MADDTTTQPDANAALNAAVQYLLGQRQPAAPPPAPVDRSVASLLGEAVGGGTTGLAPADREVAGSRALLNFGLNMLGASGYSTMPRTFGQVLAQGVGGAEQSLGSSEAVAASRLGAQQAYEEKQQELQLEKLKTAIPLLTLQTQMQQAAAARGIAGVGAAAGAPPGASIGTVGSPDEFAQKFTPIAQSIADQTGLPVDYVLAQAAHETGFGKSPAAANNNFFGITDPKTGKLASYATPQEGAAAYVELMKSDRYKSVPRTGTPAQIGDAMAVAGYNPNVPAKDKTDSYGTRIGGVAAALQRPADGTATPAPYKVASTGPTVPAPPAARPGATTAPVAPGFPQGPGAQPGVGRPQELIYPAPGAEGAAAASAIPAAPASVKVAGPGAAPAPAPAVTTPPAAPQYPDVTSGDVTIKHPGSFVDFAAKEMAPVPQTEDFNPNLSPQKQAEFAARAKGLADQQRLLDAGAVPFADQPKAAADLLAARAALEAERSKEADAKAQAAAVNTTKFNDTQREAVQKRYDAAVSAYTEAAKSKFGFHQDVVKSQATDQIATNTKMMEPYSISATQAAGLIPTIALARQILPELPQNAAPWLADENNRAKLESLAPFLPANWVKATDGASLYSQIMSNIIGTMGSNVQSGQTGGRESAYQQFKAEYPGLANTPEGRERGLLYAQELLERRMKLDEAMQVYRANAARDPVTGIPDMSAARSTVESKVPMLQLPPVSYRPDLPPTDPKERANTTAYVRYYAKIPAGGRYIGYERDDRGAMHPVAKTKISMDAPP